MSAHAALFVTRGLVPLIREPGFINVWNLEKRKTLNELWIENGRFSTDVYAYGDVSYLTVRQLRAHGFIFIRKLGEKIETKDGEPPYDVTIRQPIGGRPLTLMEVENQIGRARVRLRRDFGDVLRTYALKKARDHHGCEAETIMQAEPRIHRLFGMPNGVVELSTWRDEVAGMKMEEGNMEKLVAMLDYFVYSADVIIYVGAGDLKSIESFCKLDKRRFARTRWICIDPVTPKCKWGNVQVENFMVRRAQDISHLVDHGPEKEVGFLWDVRTDREDYTEEGWEEVTKRQDELGEQIAETYSHIFAYALLKRRIPRNDETVRISGSWILPQPYAGNNMYEVRVFLKLGGFAWQNRTHIPKAEEKEIECSELRLMVEVMNAGVYGRDLKRRHLENIHIVRADGLLHPDSQSRADLFYLTNMRNVIREKRIEEILSISRIATVWVGDSTLTGYDDFTYSARKCMLTQSNAERMVLDGLGFMLFMMWKRNILGRNNVERTSFDPGWASRFLVIFDRPNHEFVPDVTLSRFIGIRRVTSLYRMTAPSVYQHSDEIKSSGLDVSGHLLAALVTGQYGFDLYWWVRMILEWSSQDREGKKKRIAEAGAQVIEWKEERAEEPWHRKEDLIAALHCASRMQLPSVSEEMFSSWISTLRLL